MELQIGPEIIGSYKRLSYKQWYAFAEFIDNSTQAYENNKELLKDVLKKENNKLYVKITFNNKIIIADNSIGMSESELKDALTIGKPPTNPSGRSKYGLGMKTAACWFGNLWTITTKKYGEKFEHKIIFDVDKVTHLDIDLPYSKTEKPLDEHYTIIEIEKLNVSFSHRTHGKIKEHLRSFYRIDINNDLDLYLQGEKLVWDHKKEIDNRLLINKKNQMIKENFSFLVNTKNITGWAGVFKKGSRKDAGFSIIQSNRVIKGWPTAYKPENIYGETGRNDLVNQRLIGEIYLDGFNVSHTKDEILFEEGEQETLEDILKDKLAELIQIAKEYRKYESDERTQVNEAFKDIAVKEMINELTSEQFIEYLLFYEDLGIEEIEEMNKLTIKNIIEKDRPEINLNIRDTSIKVFFFSESVRDPYLLTDPTLSPNEVIILINLKHPFWMNLRSQESISNYIRTCIYDGTAEWKANYKSRNMRPNTIKEIKDHLLRLPFRIDSEEQL